MNHRTGRQAERSIFFVVRRRLDVDISGKGGLEIFRWEVGGAVLTK